MKKFNADFEIASKDLLKLLELKRENDFTFSRRHSGRRFGITDSHTITTNYLSYDEIQNYLNYISHAYTRPGIKTSLTKIGKTYEGRNIMQFSISTVNNQSSKDVILLDAGIHAREHTSISLALYIIDQLMNDPTTDDLLEKYVFIIVPLLNPDGYEYSLNRVSSLT